MVRILDGRLSCCNCRRKSWPWRRHVIIQGNREEDLYRFDTFLIHKNLAKGLFIVMSHHENFYTRL